jgi:hypothetical protein
VSGGYRTEIRIPLSQPLNRPMDHHA